MEEQKHTRTYLPNETVMYVQSVSLKLFCPINVAVVTVGCHCTLDL
jgi:hypothetical protein